MNNQEKEKAPSQESNDLPDAPAFVTIPVDEAEKLREEAQSYKDKYLRSLAEMENARKRLQKERQEGVQFAIQNVIVEFLNPIDQMENALGFTEQMSQEVKHWAMGFQMILNHFKNVLNVHGVTPFTSIGMPFNPHDHEAVEAITTTTSPHGTVLSETLKGYKMGERTIRPARVTVAQSPDAKSTPLENN